MKTVIVRNKHLDTLRINEWIVEDERNFEPIQFIMDNESGLSELSFYLIYKNSEGKGGFERLVKEADSSSLVLTWFPSHQFSQTSGHMDIQLIGISFKLENGSYVVDKRWSTLSSDIFLHRNIEVGEIAPDVGSDIIEEALATMLGYKESAASSASAASSSAGQAETFKNQAATSAGNASASALVSEGHATGKQGGTPVGPESPYYQKNSKFFAEQAETSASDAKDYAQDADDARIASVEETISPDDGGTNTITITYKDGTTKTFTVTNGHTGEAFYVYKTYATIAAMQADLANVPKGKFVLIASNVTDPDNAKLYYRNASAYEFITDLSGATGAGIPAGGTTGQVIRKKSNSDYDLEWSNEQDVSGKANKSEMSVTPGTGADADKTIIQLKTGTSATVLTQHQDISPKADKSVPSEADNLALLNNQGNLKDSGINKTVITLMQAEIAYLRARGRFLSLWDCAAGTPVSFPLASPYTYQTGDYFIVSATVDSILAQTASYDPLGDYAVGDFCKNNDKLYECNTPITGGEVFDPTHWDERSDNYRPDGASYTTGDVSTEVEATAVNVNDTYYYDGASWLLLNGANITAFAGLAGKPYDNVALAEQFEKINGPVAVYNPSLTYNMGDVVKYEDSLHYCIRQTTGTFIAMDWVPYDLYTISTLLDSLQWNKLGVDAVTSVITQDQLKVPSNFAVDMAMTGIRSTRTEYSSSATYSKGDYVIYWGGLYRAKQNIGTPEAWDATHWELVDLTTLKAGVDLSRIETVIIDRSDNSIHITLPPPVIEIESTAIDNSRIVTEVAPFRYDFSEDEIARIALKGRDRIKEALPQMDLVRPAQEEAARMLAGICEKLGYTNVVVDIPDYTVAQYGSFLKLD